MPTLTRRELLAGTAGVLVQQTAVRAGVIAGHLPFDPAPPDLPAGQPTATWQFFSAAEAAAVEALADRIIPPDPETPGGRGAGCAVFVDRQLAGPYGRRVGLYVKAPFESGLKQQGPQSPSGPAEHYRAALAALDRYCRSKESGRPFAELSADRQDALLAQLEKNALQLDGVDGQEFFETLLKDVQEGFFADPRYGGNRDMCAWKMIGFPGAHYDYRDWVGRHNERYPHGPVSIAGRADWNPGRG